MFAVLSSELQLAMIYLDGLFEQLTRDRHWRWWTELTANQIHVGYSPGGSVSAGGRTDQRLDHAIIKVTAGLTY